MPKKTTAELVSDFVRFDGANPEVYEMFKRFTYEAIRAGHSRLSATLVIERIRWETSVATVGGGIHPKSHKPLKLSNNHRTFYAAKFMMEHPTYDGFFKVHDRKNKASS